MAKPILPGSENFVLTEEEFNKRVAEIKAQLKAQERALQEWREGNL